MTQPPVQDGSIIPDPARDSKTFKKLLMDQVRARGGTEAVNSEIEIETPRDRKSSFESKIVAKRQTSVGNFGEAVSRSMRGE